jgi:hypothetical protein
VVGKNPPKLQQPKEGDQTDAARGPSGQMIFQKMYHALCRLGRAAIPNIAQGVAPGMGWENANRTTYLMMHSKRKVIPEINCWNQLVF